jgi:type III restriction enzyme
MTSVKAEFSLADITEYNEFTNLGRRIAADPEGELRRTRVSARVVDDGDGLRHTELVRAPAEDKVESEVQLFPLATSRDKLADAILSSDIIPARDYGREQRALEPILDAFIGGLGLDAEKVLSAFGDKASARLVRLVTEEARRFATPTKMEEVVELVPFLKERSCAREITGDRRGPFDRKKGYKGWTKSLYAVEWFDSGPERDMANLLDGAGDIVFWARLHTGDLPILWRGEREYHPDFIAVENDGTHWVIEVKADRDVRSEEVQGKRDAALRWARHVSSADNVGVTWRYLLVSQSDLKDAKDSWPAARAHGS